MLSSDLEREIRQIGQHLDQGGELEVMNGGFVAPIKSPVPLVMGASEKCNERGKVSSRPATRPRQGPAAGQGATGRPRAASSPTSPACPDLRQRYEAQLEEVTRAYPGAQAWPSEDGLFIVVESRLLAGLERTAVIVLAVRYRPKVELRAWAFWEGLNWIGPRHTNFHDGSICAFDPRDENAWKIDEPLVDLLDLYTSWVFCQLHLEVCERWPGLQSSPTAWERLLEVRGDEFCGCGRQPYKLYADCCQTADKSGKGLRQLVRHAIRGNTLKRSPPSVICGFARHRSVPPAVALALPA